MSVSLQTQEADAPTNISCKCSQKQMPSTTDIEITENDNNR